MSLRALAGKLHVEPLAIEGVLHDLSARLAGTGLALVHTETEVSLAVAPAMNEVLEAEYREDKDIGDAGLEVLAVILYRGASTKAQIDYIRGVNTASTIRSLLSRGLIERTSNPADSREYLYRPTTELLAHLGVTSVNDLPEYAKIVGTLTDFERAQSQPAEPFADTSRHAHTTDTISSAAQ